MFMDPQGEMGRQILHTFFCRALYDYQSNDLSSLSFRRGDVIEVLTMLESGWWDGLLNDERGWFPSNYVVQISDEEAAAELMRIGLLSANEFSVGQESEWVQEQTDYGRFQRDGHSQMTPGLTGTSSDFWVPEVTSDGQIYYVNTLTGDTARELPTEDYEPHATALPSSEANVPPSRSRSNSNVSEDMTQPELAGFGVQKRSDTPEGWRKRLADDGMSYYYVNNVTGEMRWTPPSPHANGGPRLRADSDATYDSNRLSVYSDSSEIHPFVDSASSAKATPPPPPPPVASDVGAAEEAARQLQDAMQPAPAESFADLVEVTRDAIQGILQTTEPAALSTRVDDAVQAVRSLLYCSGTLVVGIRMHDEPSESEEIINTRLKPLQRKVTATLSKVVLSARAVRLNATFPTATLGRVHQDAADLESSIAKFAEEVDNANVTHPSHPSTKRLTGVLVSGEGPAGVGIGLVGAGIGGGWKGLGFVPTEEAGPHRRLGTSLINEFQDQKAILDERCQILAGLFASNTGLSIQEVRETSRDFLSRLFIFTNALADTNVAQHVDVDGVKMSADGSVHGDEDAYRQSISKARILIRRLEATIQALYDAGACLMLAAQTPIEASPIISAVIPSLSENIGRAVEQMEGLYGIGHEQANLFVTGGDYDYAGSISWRLSRSSIMTPFDGATLPSGSTLGARSSITEGEGDFVDMEAAFSASARPPASNGTHLGPDTASHTGAGEFLVDGHRQSGSVASFTSHDAPSMATIVGDRKRSLSQSAELLDEDDTEIPKPKVVANSSKIEKFFGSDAPRGYLEKAKAESKPWYLKADYPPQDIVLAPDGSVRAGTLPALVEHLTDHEYRDTNYISTFLLTFKSFASVDEVFDLLVARFKTAPPELTEAQLQEWKSQKQEPFQIRVLNILKQIIMEDDVLDQEDTDILTRIRDFAVSVQDISPPAKLLVRVAERALNGEDAIIKTLTKSANSAPPLSILPRMGRKMKLLDIDALELARQLTIQESNLYNRIRVMECLSRAKEQKSKNSTPDNISLIIERTNQVAAWLNSQILERDDSRKRAAIIKYFINVADRCRAMHNFSTMAALVSALNTPPIRRLKRTWEQVGARSIASLEMCERTFDSNKNFNNYRTTLAKIEPPCVPFLGVYLTTLVFINEGSKDIIPPPQPAVVPGAAPPPPPTAPLINFAKRQKAAEVIREIKNWQSKPYNLTSVTVIQSFIEESLSEIKKGKIDEMSDFFWNRSLELEPREREDEKMARLLQESGFL